ncbi:MAG: DNA-formamidopyrimidine glycosylase [Actinomycetota bacterium]|nr:DNA-formamidopyrimidine glycosylase [Actinomycetota bacterium]
MPEMPEVETIRRELEEKVKGEEITKVEVRSAKPLKNATVEEFTDVVEGATIEDVKRRGKILIINLSAGYSLLIHLKLTGRILYQIANAPMEKHTHVIFSLDDHQLRFWDQRQFGYIKVFKTEDLPNAPEVKELGPEAMGEDFILEVFQKLLQTRKRGPIKPLLMDQNFIAGVGNVYADEALYYAGVQPTRIVSSLSRGEIAKIYEGIRRILPAALEYRGSSVDLYVDIYGRQGEYVPYLKVYGREGEPCERCGTPIRKITLRGRGAHFCPKCQK